jgi:hypothetical protein
MVVTKTDEPKHEREKRQAEMLVLTTITKRYKADHHGPRVEEDEGWRRKRRREIRAEILKYVVTIRRNNVLWVQLL